jgi:hypothetical protein
MVHQMEKWLVFGNHHWNDGYGNWIYHVDSGEVFLLDIPFYSGLVQWLDLSRE